jgi:hypothetical protein
VPDKLSRDSPEYLAALALQGAGGNYQRALDNARLALKVLARWKLQNVIDDGCAFVRPSPITRLTVDYDLPDR